MKTLSGLDLPTFQTLSCTLLSLALYDPTSLAFPQLLIFFLFQFTTEDLHVVFEISFYLCLVQVCLSFMSSAYVSSSANFPQSAWFTLTALYISLLCTYHRAILLFVCNYLVNICAQYQALHSIGAGTIFGLINSCMFWSQSQCYEHSAYLISL